MPGGPGLEAGDADRLLAETGVQLTSALLSAVPGWVRGAVERVLGAWEAAGGTPVEGGADSVLARAEKAGRQAAVELAGPLTELLSADVDDQWTTPLALVRRLVVFPTAVLTEAGIPPLRRDRFTEERFPDDPYDLTPTSLAGVDPELAELGLDWGAAKAAAHRGRHR